MTTYKRKVISGSLAAVLQKDLLIDSCMNKQTNFQVLLVKNRPLRDRKAARATDLFSSWTHKKSRLVKEKKKEKETPPSKGLPESQLRSS